VKEQGLGRSRTRGRVHDKVALSLVLALTAASAPAESAGLYFADRGVRPAGRGGAFIAGADDLGAIAYNPAGFYEAGSQVLFDASWLHFTSEYTRQALVRQVDPNTGQTVGTFRQTFPTVNGASPVLPIPTIAASFQPHKQWVVAFGAWAPYAAITSYPDVVNGKPAPQRYSLITLDGSALAFVGGGAAFAPSKEWRIGAAIGMLTGTFKSTTYFSGCVPERFFCSPEDPDWDVLGEVKVGPIFAPSGEIGAIYIPNPGWRFGASIQLPVFVRAPATVKTRLPASPIFERASQDGEDAQIAFDLPWNIRVGVENRMIDRLRVEVGFGYERWGMHDAIRIEPDGIALRNVVGLPRRYMLPTLALERNFQDSVSVRAGAEYGFTLAGYEWDARAGLSFETSAVPTESLTVLTIDSNKVTTSLGLSLHIRKKWRFDTVYAHVFAFDVDVDPREANIAQVVPTRARPSRNPDFVNGGQYSARADVVGLGLAYTFDAAPAEFMNTKATTPKLGR
jgi:long-chain fatty acid transport protein